MNVRVLKRPHWLNYHKWHINIKAWKIICFFKGHHRLCGEYYNQCHSAPNDIAKIRHRSNLNLLTIYMCSYPSIAQLCRDVVGLNTNAIKSSGGWLRKKYSLSFSLYAAMKTNPKDNSLYFLSSQYSSESQSCCWVPILRQRHTGLKIGVGETWEVVTSQVFLKSATSAFYSADSTCVIGH